jgi:lysozyme
MKINNKGLELLKRHEGLELTAYRCPADVLTIGYGHTGTDVYEGQTITSTEATTLLQNDLAKFEAAVEALVPSGLTENQFSALVSFTYNCGVENLKKSTLLKKLKAGDLADAADEFLKWTKAKGRVLPGLVKRREDERELFLS